MYDADHERRRKEQLNKLFGRSAKQIEEEEYLQNELKKIEQKNKEREKKCRDLQKLSTVLDSNAEARRLDKKSLKRKLPQQQRTIEKNVSITLTIFMRTLLCNVFPIRLCPNYTNYIRKLSLPLGSGFHTIVLVKPSNWLIMVKYGNE